MSEIKTKPKKNKNKKTFNYAQLWSRLQDTIQACMHLQWAEPLHWQVELCQTLQARPKLSESQQCNFLMVTKIWHLQTPALFSWWQRYHCYDTGRHGEHTTVVMGHVCVRHRIWIKCYKIIKDQSWNFYQITSPIIFMQFLMPIWVCFCVLLFTGQICTEQISRSKHSLLAPYYHNILPY